MGAINTVETGYKNIVESRKHVLITGMFLYPCSYNRYVLLSGVLISGVLITGMFLYPVFL